MKRVVAGRVGEVEEGVAGATSLPLPEDDKVGPDESDVETVAFPEEYREPLRGLLYLGELTSDFEFAGHGFSLRTLTERQLLKAAQLTSQHERTLGYQIAYRCAIVSSALTYVDGEPFYTALSVSEDEARARYEKVLDWFPVVVDFVYNKYLELDALAASIGEHLGESSGERTE